jgi:2-iminobutanoate/2-iminopropanoate deaminase
MTEKIYTDKAPKPIGPYSQAVKLSGYKELIFTSGQIALGTDGNMNGGGIAEQTEQVCENLKSILEASGSSLKNVLKTTVYLDKMSDFAAMNEVYSRYFGEAAPSRSTIEAASLPKNALVFIDVIAYI